MNNIYSKAVLLIFVAILAAITASFFTYRAMLNHTSKNCFEKKIYPGAPEQLAAISSGWSSLYHLPQDSPARFALNDIATRNSWRSFNLLRGNWPGTDEDRETAANYLKELRERIDTGLKWPTKTPPKFNIPYCKTVPVLDGNLNDPSWDNALTFQESYLMNQRQKINDGSIWKIMWDEKYLYIGASFQDANIIASEDPSLPYLGDSLEMFIMPSKRMKMYNEVIIGCNGDTFEALQCNNRYGGWASNPSIVMDGLKFKISKQKNSFTIEAAVPFSELPNYMNNNSPLPGQTIHFALIRTDKKDKDIEVEFFSAYPLLYGGHNIFGYAKGTLTK